MPNATQDDKVTCPKCGSTQVHADKKGFSGLKACLGFLMTGGLGLLCGMHKANKLRLTCLKCRHSW